MSVSRHKSLDFLLICTLVLVSGCASTDSSQTKTEPLVQDKYSLAADREALSNLRKEIPEEIQKENDEKAFMDQMMLSTSSSPTEVRNKFSRILNKKRELFNKDMNRARQEFNNKSKKDQEEFIKIQQEQRKSLSRKKVDSDARKEFYDSLDLKRKDFFSEQKEKRDVFEENIREQRKNFDDYVRAKTDEFNQLHRDYSKRFEEAKKLKAAEKQQAEKQKKEFDKKIDAEYETIRQKSPTVLEPENQ